MVSLITSKGVTLNFTDTELNTVLNGLIATGQSYVYALSDVVYIMLNSSNLLILDIGNNNNRLIFETYNLIYSETNPFNISFKDKTTAIIYDIAEVYLAIGVITAITSLEDVFMAMFSISITSQYLLANDLVKSTGVNGLSAELKEITTGGVIAIVSDADTFMITTDLSNYSTKSYIDNSILINYNAANTYADNALANYYNKTETDAGIAAEINTLNTNLSNTITTTATAINNDIDVLEVAMNDLINNTGTANSVFMRDYIKSLLAYYIYYNTDGSITVTGTHNTLFPIVVGVATLDGTQPTLNDIAISTSIPVANRRANHNIEWMNLYENNGDYATLLLENIDFTQFSNTGCSIMNFVNNAQTPVNNNSLSLFNLFSDVRNPSGQNCNLRSLLTGTNHEIKFFNTEYAGFEGLQNSSLSRNSLTNTSKIRFTDTIADMRNETNPMCFCHTLSPVVTNGIFGDVLGSAANGANGTCQLFYEKNNALDPNYGKLNCTIPWQPHWLTAGTDSKWEENGLMNIFTSNVWITYGTTTQGETINYTDLQGLTEANYIADDFGLGDRVCGTNWDISPISIFSKALSYTELNYISSLSVEDIHNLFS